MLSFARCSSSARTCPEAMSAISLGHDLETGAQVFLACADVDADLAGVGVLGAEGVHGVGHPALLADLLEEARRRGAAEDRVEQRGGEAPLVRARDPGRREAEVVLLDVLALEVQGRWRRLDERRARVRARGALVGDLGDRTVDELEQALVIDAAGRREHDVPRRVQGAVVRGECLGRHGGDDLRGPDHRAAPAGGRRRRPPRSGRGRARRGCPRPSRSPRARPRARSPARRTVAGRPSRPSRRARPRAGRRGPGRRRPCARARSQRSARRPACRRSRRCRAPCARACP